MKEYKLGYLTSNYVIEVIAKAPQERIDKFLEMIDLIELEDIVDTISGDNIKNIIKDVLKQETIDLTKIKNMIQSDSELYKIKLFEIMKNFFELFDYELYFSYENGEFNRITKMISLVGIMKDKKHYIELANALVGNTIVMKFIGKPNLINLNEVIDKNKDYKSIDKNDY